MISLERFFKCNVGSVIMICMTDDLGHQKFRTQLKYRVKENLGRIIDLMAVRQIQCPLGRRSTKIID